MHLLILWKDWPHNFIGPTTNMRIRYGAQCILSILVVLKVLIILTSLTNPARTEAFRQAGPQKALLPLLSRSWTDVVVICLPPSSVSPCSSALDARAAYTSFLSSKIPKASVLCIRIHHVSSANFHYACMSSCTASSLAEV